MITDNLKLFLDHTIRFYDRRFITREALNSDLPARFEALPDVAKEHVLGTTKSFSEISDAPGFPYPQHFSRWFKKMTGMTPGEYRG